MGRLSNMHRKGQMRRGSANSHPLRKVVDVDEKGREVLECGHHQRAREDFIGPTQAMRRRCARCGIAAKSGINDESEASDGDE